MTNPVQKVLHTPIHIICHTDYSSECGQKLTRILEQVKLPDELVCPSLSSAYHDLNGQRNGFVGLRALLKRANNVNLENTLKEKYRLNDKEMMVLRDENFQFPPIPTIVFIDLFFHSPQEIPQVLTETLKQFPAAVFVLYVDREQYARRKTEFPAEWVERLEHYFKLFDADENVLMQATQKLLESVRPVAVAKKNERTARKASIFISYSRTDKAFADDLVVRLRGDGYAVWIDNRELVGGSDWMDSIEQALDHSQRLILIMSPEALESRYVKMEYRYFINGNKPIIPVLAKPVQKLPPELSLYQFIDFSQQGFELAYSQLVTALVG